jgi:hypothetical protein
MELGADLPAAGANSFCGGSTPATETKLCEVPLELVARRGLQPPHSRRLRRDLPSGCSATPRG